METSLLEHSIPATSPLMTETVYANKIASSAARLVPQNEICIAAKNGHSAGDIVAVRVTADSDISNVLELGSGRMATVNHQDIIVGVLGKRRALKGFVGYVPSEFKVGETLNVLNLGGVIGKVTGSLQGLHTAIEVEYLGTLVDEKGSFLTITSDALDLIDDYEPEVPIVFVAGTCMQAGKTKAAGELVKGFKRAGMRVGGAKLTGIACLRDTLFMEDYGAEATLDFMACGFASTIDLPTVAPLAKSIVKKLSERDLDVIVIELGDGLMGYYNVESLFHDQQMMAGSAALVLCANDFVGAWGGIEFLRNKGVEVTLVSGPATDSGMAVEYIEKQFGVAAANARSGKQKFFDLVHLGVQGWVQKQKRN